MKVLVTGGAGFIGSHIVDRLIKECYKVVVVDNLSTGKIKNISSNVSIYPIDINDASLENIFCIEKPDIVIHQAAQVSVKDSMDNPMNDCKQNVNGTIHLLNCCIKHKVKKIIFASSADVYGSPKNSPIHEANVLKPESFYGISKLTSEEYIQLYYKLYDLNYTILRYANVYGPRQNSNGEAGVISIFLERIINNQSLTVYGDGTQKRDFIFVKDVAEANVLAIHQADNEIINISSNSSQSINNLVFLLSLLCDKKPQIVFSSKKPGELLESCLSNKKAKDLLFWEPNFSLIEGINETLATLLS